MTFKEVLKEKIHHDLGFDFYVKRGKPSTFRIIDGGMIVALFHLQSLFFYFIINVYPF